MRLTDQYWSCSAQISFAAAFLKKLKFTRSIFQMHVIQHCLAKFYRWNAVISVGIHAIENFAWGQNVSKFRFQNKFKFVTRIHSNDQQKTTWFESDLYVSCASYIATHSTIDNGPNLSQNFTEILLVWPHIYSQICLHIINNCCIEPSLHPNFLFFDNLIYINNKEQEICEKCGKK